MSPPKLRILLIYPPFLEARIHEEDIRAMPIGLFHIAAVLKEEGYPVALLNLNDGRSLPNRAIGMIKEFRPDVVGFSILNANRWGAIEIARQAKADRPGVVTVFGGVGASFLWEHLLSHFKEIDYVVVGEGERTMLGLLQLLENPEPAPIDDLGGIAFRKDGQPFRSDKEPLIEDLDQLPDPSRYFGYQHLVLTRGCPANCRFCGSPEFWGRKVRSHSAGYFVDQIERLVQKGISFFYVSDDTFTLRKKTVIDLCRDIIARKLSIHWAAISRVDTVDEEVLRWMRRAGCIQISYGIESANQDIRRYLDKRIQIQDVKAAFAATRRFGILPRAYFIYGCPGDTPETMQEILDLIREIKPLGAIFYILDIFPGTRLYEDYLHQTGKTDDIWLDPIEDILYFETDPTLDQTKIQDFGRTLRNGFYRMLPSFALDLDLVEEASFSPLHADFLSRLAMTFHKGDYARIEAIPDKRRTAETLYRRALQYHPDSRAYLGLGMLWQQRGEFTAASEILSEGIGQAPNDIDLQTCLAVNDMNQGHYEKALDRLQQLEATPAVGQWIERCRQALRP